MRTNDKPIIFIHIDNADKEALRAEAEKRGMMLTTYCRMVLLESLNARSKK